MSTSQLPTDAPPTYEAATGSSSAPTPGIRRVTTDGPAARKERNGIPPEHRRSMEDEMRELPPGWVRSFDPQSEHQFFVDTRANPPRSLWVHPYDDEEFLSTLSPEERKKHSMMQRTMTLEDLAAEDSDHEDAHPGPMGAHSASAATQSGPTSRGKAAATATATAAACAREPEPTGVHKFSRKLKDKLTGQTHCEREQARAQRAEQERQAYLVHMRARQALVRAIETGQPQFLSKDAQGRDIYIEPPRGPYAPRGAYGYNPYGNAGYQNPNIGYARPAGPYGRPYGYGYGGGSGLPLAAGLLGGALLGGALF